MTYTVGGVTVTDTDGILGPNVISALDKALAITLNTPVGATGGTISVTTAGGTATLTLADLTTPTLAAEGQGTGAADGVGGTLATATALAVGPSTLTTVTGRLNAATDVDLYRLDSAEAGGILTVTAAGNPQPTYIRFRLFNQAGVELAQSTGSLSLTLPAAATYYLGVSAYYNSTYNPVDGTGTTNGSYGLGDHTLTLRYADPGTTSLDRISASAVSGIPTEGTLPSANTRQTITLEGAGFTTATRVVFTTFDDTYPQNGLQEATITPTSVAPDGLSLTVVVPLSAVTGRVRLADEPGGLVLQIVPTLSDVDVPSGYYSDGAALTLTGTGLVEGAQTVLLGSAGTTRVQDIWKSDGPDSNYYYDYSLGQYIYNGRTSTNLPADPPTGPVKVRTLGGTSAAFAISLTGIATGTVADRGTPANAALPSANVREAVTLLGSGFDTSTQVIFPTQGSNDDLRGTRLITPTAVAANGTSITVLVPDDAVTGDLKIVGAEGAYRLQIVPTIVQVLTPSSFATGNGITIQGSGFIEGDVTITLGDAVLVDTGAFIGPDVHDSYITFAGKDRWDNDGLNLAIPPGSANGPWTVTTSGGSARFGVLVDLGVVVQETRAGRTVAPGEQELFKATAAVDGWLDFDVAFSANHAVVEVQRQDGTPATLVEYSDAGGLFHARVAAVRNQVFYFQTNGTTVVAAYDLVVTNQDRFDDPAGLQHGAFSGNYGSDPDGRNDTVDTATAFTPASYVNESWLTLTPGEADWFTWTAQATGNVSVGALFTATSGQLGFRVYADTNNNGILDPLEAAAPVTGSSAADGTRASGILATRGERFWTEVFGSTSTTKNVYAMTFSNLDIVDAGLLAGHPATNDVRANAVDLGWDVSWNSSTVSDVLTIHQPGDLDWFKLTTGVAGSLRVLVDNEFPDVGQVNAAVIDAATNTNLTLLEFRDLGSRLQFTFVPVAANQALYVQFTGQPNSYTFSIQNLDRLEDNPSMAAPANRGAVVHDRQAGLSLPGLPDVGTRDEDWFKLVTPAPDSRIDITVTPVATFGGDVTVRIWRDIDGDAIPDAGELLTEATSIGGAAVTVTAPAIESGELYVQVFDPVAGPLTGVAYNIDFANVDKFDKADAGGAANNTSVTATDLGAVVQTVESGLTLLPLDTDWFTVTARGASGTVDVLVTAQGDQVVAKVYRDANSDGTPETLVATGTGRDLRLEAIPAVRGERLWVQMALVNPADLASAGSLVRLEVRNADRFDDAVGDGHGGVVNNPPTGNDPDGLNNGPRTTGAVVEGTLRLVQPNPLVPATMQGHIGVSTDGLGTFTIGNLQAEIPAGSTIEMALLYVVTRSSTGPYRPAQIGFEGSTVGLQVLPNIDNAAGVDFETLRVDVTSIVAAKAGLAAGGVFSFGVDETIANGGVSDQNLASAVEGTALVVIYSNPTLPVRSIAVLEGGLSGPATQTTRLILSTPVDKTDPNFLAQLRLGVSFGYQLDAGHPQYSTVSVNGSRMTSAAGNFNDGSAANGTLITVGGVGDNLTNPIGPFDTTDITDDELYNLAPFLTNGQREIVLDTANPSDDDSIFLAVITVSGETSLGGILTDLGDVGNVTETHLTLPTGDQDWFRIEAVEVGDMSATLNFAADGSATALMYRDANDDGLPDDLNNDGVPDSAGIVTVGPNQLLISHIPASQVGDVFLLRVFNPVGQVEYDLDVRVNQYPVAVNDVYSVDEDGTLVVTAAAGVLSNDTDGDGDPLTSALLGTGAAHGTLNLNSDGSFTYAPIANFSSVDSFTYTANDGFGGIVSATATITVNPVNDAPVDGDESVTTLEDTTATGNVLANASDAEGDALTVTQFQVAGDPTEYAAGSTATIVGVGTLTLAASGDFTFTPAANYAGAVPVATYTVADGQGGTDTSMLAVMITPVNDAPVDGDESVTTLEDIAATGNVLANATDVEGDAPMVTLFQVAGDPTAYAAGSTATIAGVGTLTIAANGNFTFTPEANYAGAVPVTTYTVADGQGGTDTSTLTVAIAPVNDAPTGADNTITATEDTAYVFSAAGFGFSDVDAGDTLSAVRIDSLPGVGTLSLDGVTLTGVTTVSVADIDAGKLTYQGALNGNGTNYSSFTFSVRDQSNAFDAAPNTMTVDVTPVNDGPTTTPVTLAGIGEDSGARLITQAELLGNASDVDGPSLSATTLSIASGNGTLVNNNDTTWSYTPALNDDSSVSFPQVCASEPGALGTPGIQAWWEMITGQCAHQVSRRSASQTFRPQGGGAGSLVGNCTPPLCRCQERAADREHSDGIARGGSGDSPNQ